MRRAPAFPASASSLPDRARWYATEKVSLAFGYGISATPCSWLAPTAFLPMVASGSRCRCWRWRALRLPVNALSPPDCQEVLGVLRAVTGDEGTARKARVPGYAVGGKTRTVRKIGPRVQRRPVCGLVRRYRAPSDDPRIVTVVVINDPKGAAYGGGAIAAPVFSTVTQGVLRLLNVAPTDTAALAAAAAASAAGGQCDDGNPRSATRPCPWPNCWAGPPAPAATR